MRCVVAMTRDGVIGRGNALPWDLPEEMAYFKRTTMGRTVMMGRNTFDMIGSPLAGRRNVVLDRDGFLIDGAEVFQSIDDAVAAAGSEAMVIGGAETYRQLLPFCDSLQVSLIKDSYTGDVYFPEYDRSAWGLVDETEYAEFTALSYQRNDEFT